MPRGKRPQARRRPDSRPADQEWDWGDARGDELAAPVTRVDVLARVLSLLEDEELSREEIAEVVGVDLTQVHQFIAEGLKARGAGAQEIEDRRLLDASSFGRTASRRLQRRTSTEAARAVIAEAHRSVRPELRRHTEAEQAPGIEHLLAKSPSPPVGSQRGVENLLLRVRTAQQKGERTLLVRDSKLNSQVARVLVEEGYIASFVVVSINGRRHLALELTVGAREGKRTPRPKGRGTDGYISAKDPLGQPHPKRSEEVLGKDRAINIFHGD